MTELLKSNAARCPTPDKRCHETIISARRHIMELSKKGSKPFGSYYYCAPCEGYHVTSLPPKGGFRKL